MISRSSFQNGDRVRVNGLGAERFPAYAGREAIVVSKSIYPSAVRLRWSNMVTVVTINARYLERID